MKEGIYVLANDSVCEQLVALLNSIRANYNGEIPICVISYDNQIDKVYKEMQKKEKVFLFENKDSIRRWEDFAKGVWQIHPSAQKEWRERGQGEFHRLGTHRKFCAFDGLFDKFIFLDADNLIMGSLDFVFAKLDYYDFVVYDTQFKHPRHVYNLKSQKLLQVFNQGRIDSGIFCTGFFASKKGLFDGEKRNWLLSKLKEGDAEILYPFAPDQTILNYMVMKSGIPFYNFYLELPEDKRTGTCVVSTHFKEKDHILYDYGKRLTYLHYIGIPNEVFKKVCDGKNIDFPYRDILLYYRYLCDPRMYPKFKGKARPYNQPPSLIIRILRKIRAIIKDALHRAR